MGKHKNIPGHAHELTFSCYKNQPLLEGNRTKNYLVQAISFAAKKHKIHIWAYVIMPSHVHILIFPCEQNYSISKILKTIKQSVSRKEILYLKKNAPEHLEKIYTGQKSAKYRFWQDGGGYDKNVTSKDAILNMINYIHNNPVRNGIVKNPEQWEWSSYKDWNNLEDGLIEIDKEYFPQL